MYKLQRLSFKPFTIPFKKYTLSNSAYAFFALLLTLCLYAFLSFRLNNEIDSLSSTKSNVALVPNVVHYVIFNQNSINFVTYLSILSVLKVQKPTVINIHSNEVRFSGRYWDKLRQHRSNTTIRLVFFERPTHVYGQRLSSIYHSSDVARIEILRNNGGIYLDTDVVVLNSLEGLRRYEMVVGWPDEAYIGTQVLLAVKQTPFLELWLRGYKKYHPRDWYYNAGVVPTEILQKYPFIAYAENELLGVQNLLVQLHSTERWNWSSYYTVHLLSRHHPVYKNLSEEAATMLPTNFGEMMMPVSCPGYLAMDASLEPTKRFILQ